MKVAVVQMCSGNNKNDNVEKAEWFIRLAARGGAELIVLPEHFLFRGEETQIKDLAEKIPGPVCKWGQQIAKSFDVWLLLGTIPEKEGDHIYNTSILINNNGEITGVYRKIHLFDVVVGSTVYKESAVFTPGDKPCVVSTSLGVFGLTVCYDIRFPELFGHLARLGAEIFLVPASFALLTGKDHWEVLLRARAIENQAYILASNQIGASPEGKISYGRSLVVDPWGLVIAQASDIETVVFAEIDVQYLRMLRTKYPFLAHRKWAFPFEKPQ